LRNSVSSRTALHRQLAKQSFARMRSQTEFGNEDETMSSTASLTELEQQAAGELDASADEPALRAWHTKYFGKQGEILLALRKIGEVPAADRKTYGQEANRIKESLTARYDVALAAERERALERDLAA